MTPTCCRWVELSDRHAVGDALHEEERRFLREHPTQCAACREEQGLWGALHAMGAVPDRAIELADVPSPVVDHSSLAGDSPSSGQVAAPVVALAARRWRVARSLSAAAAMVLVASLGGRLWRQYRQPRPTGPVATSAPAAATAVRIGFASGQVNVEGRGAQVGETLDARAVVSTESGTACLVLGEGIRACLAPKARVRIESAQPPDRRLAVLTGLVVAELDPQPPGTSFSLEAPDGVVTAIGTAFSVEVSADGRPSTTRVLHGTVLVRPVGAADKRVGAHTQSAMAAGPPTPLAAADEERDRAVLVPAMQASSAPAVARFESDPEGASVLIDERVAQRTPLSILLVPGEHSVVMTSASGTIHDVVRLEPGERFVRRFELQPPAPESAPAMAPSSGMNGAPKGVVALEPRATLPRDRTSGETLLLRGAREKSSRGDVAGAAADYRALLEHYPTSSEAAASEVAYGELQLGPMGDAAGALRAFERYLVHGGALAEEASYGRIRALRALGRVGDERSAIEGFLLAYPDGAVAAALRDRAHALEGQGAR
jgi:ferric-dicitrate binding protein FerR (iron transport regulator)